MTEDRCVVIGCRTCGVSKRLPLDSRLSGRARPFWVAHAECVTFLDLDGVSLREAFGEAAPPV